MIPVKKITLFVQCLVDGLYPEVGEAMMTLFRKLGIQVNCPVDQTCCGQPAFNAGHRKAARAAAKRFVEIFEDAEWIVCPSGSCVNMVKHHYPDLFQDDMAWLIQIFLSFFSGATTSRSIKSCYDFINRDNR